MDKNSTVTLLTGNKMPIMGFGTWQLTYQSTETIKYAFEIGYRLVDTSSDYGTQPAVGKALQESSISREQIYVVTKIEEVDDAYPAAKAYVDEMRLKYADLIVIHRPPSTGSGIPLWEGLIKAREDGLTKDIGVSNYSISQIKELSESTGVVPALNQIEWTPFGHSKEMLDYCLANQIILQAYSPLTRAKRLDNQTLKGIGQKYNKTPAQVLIRWNLQLGTVPIPKANQKVHLEENLDVFDFEISEKDMSTINNLNEHYSSLGSLPYV